eukprot:12414213-Ditylum_brightwellii.AAC.1
MVTGYGSTEKETTLTKNKPIYRIGHGATDALPNWTLVANACQKAYAKYSKGCQIQDPTGKIVQQVPGKMFVDDKNLMHNGKKPDSNSHELITYVTHDVSLWDRYIWINGGLVEHLKTKYSLMVWKFENTRAPMITPGNELPENTVNIRRPEYSTIVKRTDPNRADKLIGMHTAATQQNKTEFQYLSKK